MLLLCVSLFIVQQQGQLFAVLGISQHVHIQFIQGPNPLGAVGLYGEVETTIHIHELDDCIC